MRAAARGFEATQAGGWVACGTPRNRASEREFTSRERDHDAALEVIRTATATMREARGTVELLVKLYGVAGEVLTRGG
ncbi:MAG: hypothetical protein A2Y78_14630 [Acidobacteria bacterium RBG_13_68_16]|nr:MAG: hypothetical protein A2Y78_14630 [Acidobacteria bacterium RBG_13_68_16]